MARRQLKDARCLVVGGAGNLGAELVEELLERGASVIVFDIISYSGAAAGVSSIIGDICSKADLEKAMQGIQIVFHVASVIDIRPVASPSMRRINVEGTRNVVDCCRACGIEVLIYTSSMEVVSGYGADGNLPDYDGTDDESLPIPAHHCFPYGSTKAEAESVVLSANSETLLTCALRPGYIVGPGCIGMKIEMENAMSRSNYYVSAKLETKLNCVGARNCAVAHVLAAERAGEAEVQGHAFFISDFQGNVVGMNVDAFEETGIKVLLMPLWVAYMLGFLTDRFYRLVHMICAMLRISYEIPKTAVDIGAINMAWRNLCFSNKRSKDILGYDPSLIKLISHQDMVKQSKSWASQFYADLRVKKDSVRWQRKIT